MFVASWPTVVSAPLPIRIRVACGEPFETVTSRPMSHHWRAPARMSMIGVKFPPVPGPWIFGMFVAFAGPTRVPAAGRDARALLRMMIQPVPAARVGMLSAAVYALPAWTTISWLRFGSAAAAALIAVWMLPPALTGKVDPVIAGNVVSNVVGSVGGVAPLLAK